MLNPRELATVLAALRHWQTFLRRHGIAFACGWPQFTEELPLSAADIDQLCERLNESESQCGCELPGAFCSGVPGILARMEQGRLAPEAKVERCDLCRRFASDAAARDRLIEINLA